MIEEVNRTLDQVACLADQLEGLLTLLAEYAGEHSDKIGLSLASALYRGVTFAETIGSRLATIPR